MINSTKPLSQFVPAAAMVYTDIQTLRGLDKPIDYGTGVEYVDGLIEAWDFKSSGDADSTSSTSSATSSSSSISSATSPIGLQIGLWLNGTQGCRDIVSGDLDENLNRFLDYLVIDIPSTTKIFLRVGYGKYATTCGSWICQSLCLLLLLALFC